MIPLIILILLRIVATNAVACYSHDGISAQDSIYANTTYKLLAACNVGHANSTCCYSNEKCADDHLCHRADGTAYRQYCTDPTWTTDQCSPLCPDFNEAGVQLTTCPDGSYCCGPSNKECCAAGEGSHVDKNGVIIISGQVSSSIAWHPPPATTSRPHRTAAAQSGPATGTNGNNQLSATAAGATSTGSSLPAPSVSNDGAGSGSSSLSSGAKAGVGVGCAVGVSLIILLLFLLLRERKKRREMEKLPEVRQWGPLADRKPVIATASMQELPAGGTKVLRSEIDGRERAGELYSS